ncbi:MAG: N-formylglutamate amidohydrolase [Rhizobiaceae bacterium]|nr:N-formylglutamate amidohydrolase [Rhizobiaceae bacterium]
MESVDAEIAFEPVQVTNRHGLGSFVLLCDHASNFVPERFGTLGLPENELNRHIAWDPGAAAVARLMSQMLDSTLVESCVSRLIIDCNRPLDAPDLIWTVSESTAIPGNHNLGEAERAERIALAYEPYHSAIDEIVETRLSQGRETQLVAIHSFTPVYNGFARPWHIGVLHDEDMRLATPLLVELQQDKELMVGDNEPYSPADRVYFTLERHGRAHGLACVMIELRNDELTDPANQEKWARRLSEILAGKAVTVDAPETVRAESGAHSARLQTTQ